MAYRIKIYLQPYQYQITGVSNYYGYKSGINMVSFLLKSSTVSKNGSAYVSKDPRIGYFIRDLQMYNKGIKIASTKIVYESAAPKPAPPPPAPKPKPKIVPPPPGVTPEKKKSSKLTWLAVAAAAASFFL
ncbi:MAG: hypothetical protein AAF518_14525 [Spirochaetota bacterium]